jgi:radical SAM superfamily enzyme YgiQ (UPF0313 family)
VSRQILLLNPPARDVVIRDYYCSKTTQASYVYPPVDLLAQSGWLDGAGELHVVDAVVERLSPERVFARVAAIAPDAILSLVGAVCWPEDEAFLAELRRRHPSAVLAVTGDVVQADPLYWLERLPWADVVLGDFHRADLLHLLEGRPREVVRAAWRDNLERGGAPRSTLSPRQRKGQVDAPVPRHDLFVGLEYRFPFVRQRRFAVVLTDFGCPYPCTFCIMGTLGHTVRPVESVIEELERIRELGVSEVLFLDQSFGVHRDRSLELCRRMVAAKLDLGWVTFTRADLVDAELLTAWKTAGCHTLMFGVEFGEPTLHVAYRKGYTPGDVERGLSVARAAGIRTVGTFLLGVPEDTPATLAATVEASLRLPLDYASFNIAVPRFGTPFRERALAEALTDGDPTMDQAGATVAMPTRALSRDEIQRWHGRAVRSFYLRPRWLARRILDLRTPWEARAHLSEGLALMRRSGWK